MITYNQRFREALLERTERTEGRVRSVSKELEGAKRRGDSALKRRCEHKMQRLWLELEKDARFVRVFTGSLSAFVKESEDLDRKDIDLIRNISSEILAMWGDNFKRLFHTTFAGAGLVSIGARLYELGSFVWNLICDIAILPMALPLNLYFKAKVRKMDAKQ